MFLSLLAITLTGEGGLQRCRLLWQGHVGFDGQFYHDGKWFIAIQQNIAQILETETGSGVRSLTHSEDEEVYLARFSPKKIGEVLTLAQKKSLNTVTTKFWRLDANGREKLLWENERPVKRISFIAFFPDGERILAGVEGYFEIWDTNTGEVLEKLDHHAHEWIGVSGLISPDGKYLITIGHMNDQSIEVWDASTLERKRELFKPEFSYVTSAWFTEDSQRLFLIFNGENGFMMWDTQFDQEYSNIYPFCNSFGRSSPIFADGSLIISPEIDGVKIRSIWTGDINAHLDLKRGATWAAYASHSIDDEIVIMAIINGGFLSIIELGEGICNILLKKPCNNDAVGSFSSDGKHFMLEDNQETYMFCLENC